MAIVSRSRVIPLELRFDSAKEDSAHRAAGVVLAGAAMLKRVWWHTKSYLPIVGVLLLAAGSLMILQFHWLYRRLTHMSALNREKEVLKDVG